MKIKITVMMDQDPEEEQVQTAEAFFTFVAVDEMVSLIKLGVHCRSGSRDYLSK